MGTTDPAAAQPAEEISPRVLSRETSNCSARSDSALVRMAEGKLPLEVDAAEEDDPQSPPEEEVLAPQTICSVRSDGRLARMAGGSPLQVDEADVEEEEPR